MFQTTSIMSKSTSLSEEASASSDTTRVLVQDLGCLNPMLQSIITTNHHHHHHHHQESKKVKKKRSLPGNPDPAAEVIALSPRTLLATNRFVCEICNKGFQRDQNLQLHRRGHNLPWKLKQKNNKEVRKKAYVCPEPSCVHHHPSRALGDLTGIKKHFCRKHGEKKFKCDKCSKIYAVYSDWKAHSKTCGTREYRCDCGTLFSRKDSFVTHRAFCDALAEESARLSATNPPAPPPLYHQLHPTDHPHTPSPPPPLFPFSTNQPPPPPPPSLFPSWEASNLNYHQNPNIKHEPTMQHHNLPTALSTSPLHVSTHSKSSPTPATSSHMSATALLQKACTVGAVTFTTTTNSQLAPPHQTGSSIFTSSINGFTPLGHVATEVIPPPPQQPTSDNHHHYMGLRLTSGDLATWQKNDHLTRDFLGLTGHQHHHQYNATAYGGSGGGAAGHENVSMSVHDMLKYASGLEYASGTTTATTTTSTIMAPVLERDHSLLKHHQHGFGFAASETWGDC